MPKTAENQSGRPHDIDEDDTLREVGEDHDFEVDDEIDPVERRRDPLRQPH